MTDQNETVVRRFMSEVVDNGNYSALRELVHPDYVYRSPDQELVGPEALEAFLRTLRDGLPDLATSIDDLVVSQDKVALSFTMTGSHTGNLMGIPATGKRLAVRGMVLGRLEDGKIREERELLDTLGMLRQLGVVSLPA